MQYHVMKIECVLGLSGKYRTHGAKQAALVRTCWCARSRVNGKRRNLDLDPSNTSPYTPSSSLISIPYSAMYMCKHLHVFCHEPQGFI
jgi:hypothetical protein